MLHLTITANGVKAPYEFGKIVVYGHGEKLFERDSLDVFEMKIDRHGVETISESWHGSPVAFSLVGEIKKALKENLNRKDNYVLLYTPEYFPRERRTALYIHESEIAVEDLGDLLAMQTKDEKCYLHTVRLRFRLPVTFSRPHVEHIQCGNDWRIPDGGHWGDGFGTVERPCYEPYDYTDSPREEFRKKGKGVIKKWFEPETVPGCEFLSTFRTYSRIEYSEERKRRDRIAEKCKAGGLRDFSHYDVEKLEKALGVTLEG
ncbi:MAG: hypothetical protein IIZ93_00465 [Acidaminococcaceae bacterium]|nr:hypothetical protein [Acidaminococcaceae bacterium]